MANGVVQELNIFSTNVEMNRRSQICSPSTFHFLYERGDEPLPPFVF